MERVVSNRWNNAINAEVSSRLIRASRETVKPDYRGPAKLDYQRQKRKTRRRGG